MATPTGPPSLIPPTTSYRDYFACTETETFHVRYMAILAPYSINPTAAAAAASAEVARLIYAAAQEDVLTMFLQMVSRGEG